MNKSISIAVEYPSGDRQVLSTRKLRDEVERLAAASGALGLGRLVLTIRSGREPGDTPPRAVSVARAARKSAAEAKARRRVRGPHINMRALASAMARESFNPIAWAHKHGVTRSSVYRAISRARKAGLAK